LGDEDLELELDVWSAMAISGEELGQPQRDLERLKRGK
jgi:hypothetical protein